MARYHVSHAKVEHFLCLAGFFTVAPITVIFKVMLICKVNSDKQCSTNSTVVFSVRFLLYKDQYLERCLQLVNNVMISFHGDK